MLFTLMNGDDRVFDFVFDEDRNAVLEIRTIFDLCRAHCHLERTRLSLCDERHPRDPYRPLVETAGHPLLTVQSEMDQTADRL